MSKDIQLILSFFIMITIVISTIAYVSLTPGPSEPFFAVFTLGREGRVGNYYPRNDSSIRVGEELQWYVGVYNRMNSIQYVVLRFKLLNQTMAAPDDQSHTPSPAMPFMEIRHLLANNETWTTPIKWSVANATKVGDNVIILSLLFNSVPVTENLSVSSYRGFNFRILIELWAYSTEAKQFEFTWMPANEPHIAWNQIWFNVTRTEQTT
jgi:uncharacterized membrane protein